MVNSRKILSFLGKFGVGITSSPNLISLYEKQEALNFTESKLSIFQNFYRKNPTKFLNFFFTRDFFLRDNSEFKKSTRTRFIGVSCK